MKPLGRTANLVSELISNVLICGAAAVIFWRLWIGLADKMSYGETTYILSIPAWIGYALASLGAGLFVLVTLYAVWRSVSELAGGGQSPGAETTDGAAGPGR